MIKRRLAREWLYFLGFLLFGLFLLPALLTLVFPSRDGFADELGQFYEALGGEGDAELAWLVVFGPYLLIQLIRSVIWAWKNSRG